MEIYLILLIILIASVVVFFLYRKLNYQSQIIKDLRAEGERWRIAPSQQVIQDAYQKANQVMGEAEINALKTAAEKEMEIGLFQDKLQSQFQAQLQQILTKEGALISQSLTTAQKKHDEFIVQLEKQNLDWQNNVENEMRGKIGTLLESFESKLTEFFTGAQKQSLDAINLELKSARQLIDSYKSQQMAIVDENIVAVLERTLNLVLKQKLTLKDQMDLVAEALEKAKLEKFLV
ncbi:MAG: hypothetical protein ACD_30C00114G0005 [uncultured bacterium]|uniref:Uncharacterized protein n=2 Tax=Candidatus Daviesiibacteriota TaxID=1752718 RepID=A0A1F5K0V9_9BACT|nr:MAG: hypothetical protein ACD_30C00114G0005 [uncultured bacterium]KKQ14535.1 MAG: hypothetical protein US28_C0034G0008 [Candidatus Daviesbacteria bacterium GW2011_GWA1_36_8]OGE34400.1 MAG: hypothetical protein A3E66_02480 [Candidatus Daviesbacteria bacterium RIFCSPHIGHO2_12_FULL_37_16]